MDRVKIALLRELLATQTNHWALFPAILLFAETTLISPYCIMGWILAGLLPVCLFFVREVLQSFLLQFLLLPVFLGVTYLLPFEPYLLKMIMLFLEVIYAGLSLMKSIKQDSMPTKFMPPFVPLVINFSLAIIAVYSTKMRFTFFMHVSAILSILCALLLYYVDRYFVFTVSNEGTASNMPKRKIFRSGIKASLLYLGSISAVLFVIASFSISDEFFRTVMHVINGWIKTFFSFLSSLFPEKERDTHVIDGGELEPFTRPEFGETHTSIFWRILEVIVFVVVIAIIVAFFANLIIKILKLLFSVRRKKILIEAEEETEILDQRERLSQTLAPLQEEEDDPRLSPNWRIRRFYRRRALSSGKEPSLLYRMTAREFAQQEGSTDLASLYEKARYSLMPCTKEDVKLMQLACRRKKSES